MLFVVLVLVLFVVLSLLCTAICLFCLYLCLLGLYLFYICLVDLLNLFWLTSWLCVNSVVVYEHEFVCIYIICLCLLFDFIVGRLLLGLNCGLLILFSFDCLRFSLLCDDWWLIGGV